MFDKIYKNKKVLIFGHTGFKGSWLTTWLLKLGAKIIGVSVDIPTDPAMFETLQLEKKITHILADICDLEAIRKIINTEKPDFIFHLAAQAIVSVAYDNPVQTMKTNVLGTLNILEVVRTLTTPCYVVLITSDKCYENVEWVWGYRETDALGGKDIYSGSKGAAELVIKSYVHSYFQNQHSVRIAVGRAGNVIGGGDWAKDRIVVDCIKAWCKDVPVEIRFPNAIRPWQHVLEPLSGYLLLGHKLASGYHQQGDVFNFGPRIDQHQTVQKLIDDLAVQWGFERPENAYQIRALNNNIFSEAGLLKLNCDKALFQLKWESNLFYIETIKLISEWYRAYCTKSINMYQLTVDQIDLYEHIGQQRNRSWLSI